MRAIQIDIPQSWNELSERQLEQIAALIHSGTKGRQFDFTVFLILVNLRWYTWLKNYRIYRVLKEVPLSELRRHYLFIYENNYRTKFPKSVLNRWERLKFWKRLTTPGDRINTLTAAEFASTEGLSKLWDKEKHRNPLQYMAATLYRPSGQEFDNIALAQLAKRFDKVPLPKLLAMELAYSGAKNAMVKRFPVAFPKSSKSASGGKHYGFGKVVLNMSGGKFGTHRETRQTNIYTFLEEFEENLKAQKSNGQSNT